MRARWTIGVAIAVGVGFGFAAPAAAQISGTARDSVSGLPMADVIVSIQSTDREVVTGADGAYSFPVADGEERTVVAARVGYFYDGETVTAPASDVDLFVEAVPEDDDASAGYAAPRNCNRCHMTQIADWSDSPMAHAGTNTWVYDIYDGTGTEYGDGGFVYVRDSPHAGDNPESECASCHQPEHWAAEPGRALDDSADLSDEALRGVSCLSCHAIASVDEARPNYPGLHPDSVSLRRPATRDWVVMYGVLGDVSFEEAGEMRGSYQPQLTSAVCGTCHQDKNDPNGNGDFEDDGVISEPTYLEWLNSEYANAESEHYATCVDCHSVTTDEPEACGVWEAALPRPLGEVRNHDFRGTTAQFIENAVTMTTTAAALGDSLEVSVTIDNDQTGHSVPTGVTIRNMILLVEARRTQDDLPLVHTGTQTIHELGGVGDPAEGYFAGLPGKLYAKMNHGPDGTGPVFFTDATGITADTRILALESDTTSYTFDVPEGGGDLHVRARLIYRRSWRSLVDAKQWTTDGQGRPLLDVMAPHFGALMEENEATVSLPYTPQMDAGADGAMSDGSADAGIPPSDDGCGCRVTSRGAPGGVDWALGLAVLLQAARRRRP